MKKKLLVEVDESVHAMFKVQCAMKGTTMGKKVEQFMRSWVNAQEGKKSYELASEPSKVVS